MKYAIHAILLLFSVGTWAEASNYQTENIVGVFRENNTSNYIAIRRLKENLFIKSDCVGVPERDNSEDAAIVCYPANVEEMTYVSDSSAPHFAIEGEGRVRIFRVNLADRNFLYSRSGITEGDPDVEKLYLRAAKNFDHVYFIEAPGKRK